MCLNHQLAHSFDEHRANAFADRLLGALNDGALCLMISLGHRTGLFDALEDGTSVSSEELAGRTGLNERYVREWLGAMATGGVMETDATHGTFRLPEEHSAFLSRRAQADNMAVFAQYIPVLAGVEDDIVHCFRNGGGVPYEKYPRFHEVMAEDSGQSVLSSLFENILPLMPGLTEKLELGIDVLDLGCGRGKALIQMAERFPCSRFTGFDLSTEAVAAARAEAAELGLTNLRFESRDLSDYDQSAEADSFDLVTTFDAVHDQAQPRRLLRGIHRTLRSDGVYLMQDIHATSAVHGNLEHPLGTLLYTVSCMHCMTVSLAQDGEGLGAMWGREQAAELLREAGFNNVEIHRLEHDIQNDYYVIRH